MKCLLREMDQNVYYQSIREYINNLDEDIKVTQEEYERRLSVCKTCSYLTEGMCGACGCFVELRASIASNVCSYLKW